MDVIKLFDYQEDMKERIEKALRLHRSVMVQMPTGTGKTVLLASVVESFLREHSNCNVWIVAHRRELVSQIKDTLNKFLLNFNFSKITPSFFTIKEGVFRKPTRPSLPLRKAPPFSPSLSSIVFTTPSVPLVGDRNPQGREDVTALRCSEPLRSKVGGASKPSPCCAGWDRLANGGDTLETEEYNYSLSIRFSSVFIFFP